MQIEKMNSLFEKFGRIQVAHGKLFLTVLFAWTVISLLGLPKFKVQSSNDGWFLESDETRINEKKFQSVFGSNTSVMFLVKSDDVFNPKVLEMIVNLGDTLIEEVPFAESIQSIVSVVIPGGGMTVTDNPFLYGIPDDDEEIAAGKDLIMSQDSLVNTLVSQDCTETWVFLKLFPFDDEETDSLLVGNAVRDIVQRQEFHSELWDINPMGDSYLLVNQNDTIESVTLKSAIAGVIMMILCLLVLTRSARGIIIPILSTGMGIGVVFGWCGHLGIKPNSSLITLPLMLGMALSIGYSIHYINAFRSAFIKTGNRKEAAVLCVKESAWPILFTVITTMATMFSFLFTPTEFLKVIGLVCAAVVFSVYVYIFITVPIFLSAGKDYSGEKHQRLTNMRNSLTEVRFAKTGEFILRHRTIVSVLALFIPVVVASAIGCFRIKVELGYIETIGTKIEFIQRLDDLMNTQLGNMYSYNLMVYFDEEGAFKKPENMKKLESLSEQLEKFPLTKITNGKPRVMGLVQIIKETNRSVNDGDQDYYCIPEDPLDLEHRFYLLETFGGDYMGELVSEDFSKTYITVGISKYTMDEIDTEADNAVAAAKALFPDAQIGIVGVPVKTAAMNKKVVDGEIQSVAISIAITAILMMLAFMSVKTGLIGMIPNIVPILFIGGFMGFASYGMDMLTMLIMPMIIGIAVDDTIHFTNRTKFYFEQSGNYKQSIISAFRFVGKSMASATIILCLIFIIYIFSPVTMMFKLGVLATLGLLMALLCDYTITPILIYLTKPFGKENKKEKSSLQ